MTTNCIKMMAVALLAACSLTPNAAGQDAGASSSNTAAEVRAAVIDSHNRLRQTKRMGAADMPEFSLNSNGNLLTYVPRGSMPVQRLVRFDLTPSNIHVTTLVEDAAAVAMFYSQGTVQFAGGPLIQGYRVRVSQTWVKGEDGWMVKTAHYSPMTGGQGVKTLPIQDGDGNKSRDAASPIIYSARAALPDTEMSRALERRIDYVFRFWREKHRGLAGSNGTHVFNSNGGMLAHNSPVQAVEFPVSTVQPRDVHIVPLVEGQAAVAFFYAEGSLQVKGGPLVSNYRTRVSQTFVKEFGRWHCKTEHWSKLQGAEGVQPVRVAAQVEDEPLDQSGFSTDCKEIDAVMHSVRMFADGNIDAWRACYADNAQWTHNQWGANNPIDELEAMHRAFHEGVESVAVTNYNFECVTYGNGVKKVNSWLKFRAKYKTGEIDERCGAFSVRIGEDSRFTYEVGLYDTAGMPGASPYDAAGSAGAPAAAQSGELAVMTGDVKSNRAKQHLVNFARGDLSYAEGLFKPDVKFVLPAVQTAPMDLDGWRQFAARMHRAFDDIEFAGLAMNTTTYPKHGTWTYAWCTYTAKSKATNEVHRFPLHLMWQWDGDRIAREFGYFDAGSFSKVWDTTLARLSSESSPSPWEWALGRWSVTGGPAPDGVVCWTKPTPNQDYVVGEWLGDDGVRTTQMVAWDPAMQRLTSHMVGTDGSIHMMVATEFPSRRLMKGTFYSRAADGAVTNGKVECSREADDVMIVRFLDADGSVMERTFRPLKADDARGKMIAPLVDAGDARTRAVHQILRDYVAGDVDAMATHFADDCVWKWGDQTVEVGKKDWVEGVKTQHKVFRDIELNDLYVMTGHYPSGNVWTTTWVNWKAIDRRTQQPATFMVHLSHRWDGDKIVEEQAFFDVARFEEHVAAAGFGK